MKTCVLGLLLFALATPAAAELKIEHAVYLAAAAADVTSTITCQQLGCIESNPTIAWLEPHGTTTMLTVGAALEGLALWAGHQWIGRRHPRVERVLLYVVAGVRVGIVARNIREVGRQQRWNQREAP